MVNLILGWLLDLIDAGLDLWPTWDPDLGTLSAFVNPLEEINYLLPVGPVFALVLGVLVLFPAFMGVTLAMWLYGLIRGGGSK